MNDLPDLPGSPGDQRDPISGEVTLDGLPNESFSFKAKDMRAEAARHIGTDPFGGGDIYGCV